MALGKRIEEIWTDAFKNNKSAALVGKKVRYKGSTAFTSAWFRSLDGRVYHLTKTELLQYMPEAKIHPSFKKGKTNG